MYRSQFPQLILFFSGVLFCLTSSPQILLYGSEDLDQSDPPEEAITPDDDTERTTQPHYRIHQLRFTGNEHLNEKKLIALFGWQEEKPYSREEIIERFERIIAGYRGRRLYIRRNVFQHHSNFWDWTDQWRNACVYHGRNC